MRNSSLWFPLFRTDKIPWLFEYFLTKLRERNLFTRVCLFTGGGGFPWDHYTSLYTVYDLSSESYWTIRASNWKIYWPRNNEVYFYLYILLLSINNIVYSRIIYDKWHAVEVWGKKVKYCQKFYWPSWASKLKNYWPETIFTDHGPAPNYTLDIRYGTPVPTSDIWWNTIFSLDNFSNEYFPY